MNAVLRETSPDLHEVTSDESFANVDVVVSTRKVCTRAAQVEPIHDARQLLANVVGTLQRSEVDEVVVAPLRIIMICSQINQSCK